MARPRSSPRPTSVSCLKSAYLLSDQLGDFSLIGKSVSFNILFRVDQLVVILNIEYTATAFDQFDIWIRIICLQFCFHTGSLRKKVSGNTIFNKNFHNASIFLNGYRGRAKLSSLNLINSVPDIGILNANIAVSKEFLRQAVSEIRWPFYLSIWRQPIAKLPRQRRQDKGAPYSTICTDASPSRCLNRFEVSHGPNSSYFSNWNPSLISPKLLPILSTYHENNKN